MMHREEDQSNLKAFNAKTAAVVSTQEGEGAEVDDEALNQLREDCGEEFELVYRSFSQEMANRLGKIHKAVERGNIIALGYEAHALHSTAATFALSRLGIAAAIIESACKSGDLPRARTQARELPVLAKHAMAALERRLRISH